MDNRIANAILLTLMMDGFIFVLVRAWQVHILRINTSGLTDKLYYTVILTLFIKILVYLGKLVGIDSVTFVTVSYIADIGFFIITLVLGIMAHEAYKKKTLL